MNFKYSLANTKFPKCACARYFWPDTSTISPLLRLTYPIIPVTAKVRLVVMCSQKFEISEISYDFGHFQESSVHRFRVSIHPSPGKKSVLYNKSVLPASINSDFPLSFQADTHQRVGSALRMGYVPRKYSKKSGATSKSSVKKLMKPIDYYAMQWRISMVFELYTMRYVQSCI